MKSVNEFMLTIRFSLAAMAAMQNRFNNRFILIRVVLNLSAICCIVCCMAKWCKVGLWCISNMNVGSTFHLVQLLTPMPTLIVKVVVELDGGGSEQVKWAELQALGSRGWSFSPLKPPLSPSLSLSLCKFLNTRCTQVPLTSAAKHSQLMHIMFGCFENCKPHHPSASVSQFLGSVLDGSRSKWSHT